jgi:hypothetical protein
MEVKMTAHAPLPYSRGAKQALLIGCAAGGLCLAASQVGAQAFNATPKTVAGGVLYDRATPGVETVLVDTSTAIINWTPNVSGNPIIFLPAGNTATFTNGPSNSDFVVLNRILTNTPVRFDGTVLSVIRNFALGTSRTGGIVLFSSPGGIIVGPNAVFDVGSLVLTSLNVVDDGAGNFYDPAAPGFTFAPFGGAPANGAVITLPGSQIRALEEGSYVALVAPVIRHGGSVRVNGSAAFVAGENVQMRLNQGLFDIIVDVGSDNAVPLIHTGSTGGPASTGAGDPHAIYMVAMPKNQAITAVLQGSVGFDAAANAAIENGVIVLSAGFNVVNGQVDRYADFGPVPKSGQGASFEIRGGTISSDLFGFAVTDMLASGQATGSLAFQQDVSLFAGRRAHLFAGAGETVTVGGNAVVSASRLDTTDPLAFDLTGGEALIFTQGGSITIAGDATVDASGRGIVDQVNSRAGNGSGGTAGIFADKGNIQINGNATLLATGEGGTTDFAPIQGGTGKGGAALVEGRGGGTVRIGGGLSVDASGTGSRASGLGAGTTVGAPGAGGTISVAATGGGSVTVASQATLVTGGTGGNVLNGPGNVGGTGQGGTVSILAGGTITFAATTSMSAAGFGGLGPNGGAALGGRIGVDANAGQIDFLGGTIMDANATGGDGSFAFGGTGGSATGGDVLIRARSGAAPSRVRAGAIAISAVGTGGAGANGIAGTPAGRGGDGRGGNVELLAEAGNGTVQIGAVIARANGAGGRGGNADINGDGGRGGDGFGGSVRAGSTAGAPGSATNGGAQFANLALGASASGGQGGFGSGAGGNAVGGTTSLLAAGIPTSFAGQVMLTADATGGIGGDPVGGGAIGATGLADGGTIVIAATAFGGTGGTLTAGSVTGSASATGAAGTGNSPGEWHVAASGGSSVNLTNLTLTAQANGTPAVRPFSSLEPQGGTISVTQIAQLATQGEIRVIASGTGRITGGRLNLAAGDDVVMSHAAPAPGGFTVDVTDFFVTARNFNAGAGVVTRTSNQTDIRATGLATIAGRVLGREILLASSDIDLPTTGGIGDGGTQLATLLPNATGQLVTLGGTAQGAGYTLTGAEAGRIRAGTLRVLVPALGTGTALLVRDLTFNGGGAATGIGLLEINTQGVARIEGALLMTNAAAGNGISLTARQRIEVATPTGSIRVRDAAGAPGGTLMLASNNIWVASPAILDRLRLDPNYPGRDADLIDNGGIEEQRGYIEGGGVVLATGGTLFVQNSGPPFSPAFGGVTVGAGGLIVQPTGAAPAVVTAFGRRLNADGSGTIGSAFFFEVNFTNNSYTPGSTFNTCIIVTRQCGAGGPIITPSGPDPITGPTGGPDTIRLPFGAEDGDLVDTSFASDPLIEEPVTSGSEASLWECDPERDERCETPR